MSSNVPPHCIRHFSYAPIVISPSLAVLVIPQNHNWLNFVIEPVRPIGSEILFPTVTTGSYNRASCISRPRVGGTLGRLDGRGRLPETFRKQQWLFHSF